MKKSIVLVGLLMMLLPFSAMAADSSSYVVAEWGLNDTSGGFPITDTSLTFINPTKCIQVLEYAFFDDEGNFCGCDRDFPGPNAVTRYTMSAESDGGMFICNKKNQNVKTHGVVKSIVFRSDPSITTITVGTATTLGFQTHFGGGRTESNQAAIDTSTTGIQDEMNLVHQACVTFCSSSGVCPTTPSLSCP